MDKFDYCVFIGRFSPFQKAHQVILNKALEIANRVIIVLGSCNSARTIKNPWSPSERQSMIESTIPFDQLQTKISFVEMNDYLYNDNLWTSTLQSKIGEATDYSENVALIGYESDETSYYLKLFPQYKFVRCNTDYKFHASQVRDFYFSHDVAYKTMVPENVIDYLEKFKTTDYFKHLKQEKDYVDNYKNQWVGAPYPPVFQTVDCVVVKSAHVLVVERKFNPGKGLFALPGGFMNPKELLIDGALRELKEETGIKINSPDLKKAIVESKTFDAVHRSERGRVLTTAFLINLGMGQLPQVAGGDDAAAAQWLPLSDFYSMATQFFEDHWHIVSYFCNKF